MRGRSRGLRSVSGLAMVMLSVTSIGFGWAAPREADETALRALMAQMVEAWNRRDSRSLAGTFTADGELVAGDGTQMTGRGEIERYFAGLLAKLPQGTRFTAAVTSVRLIGPDAALLSSSGGFLMPGDTEVTPERRGLQSLVAVRDGGAWRAALFQRTRIPPPPAAAPTR
jgi:uncharacterized protein (TIGR02246 family)